MSHRRTRRRRRRAADLAPRSRRRRQLGDRRVRPVRHRPRPGSNSANTVDLWRWSVDHLEEFWVAVWDFFAVEADGGHEVALAESAAAMPGARWFPGTRLNYAEHALRRRPGDDDIVAVTAVGEDGTTSQTTWAQLRAQVAALAQWLRDAGVQRGDRVVGYLPDTTPTLVAFLAAASVGAIWSACAQDYGADGAAARFAQLAPGGPVRRRRLPVERPGARPPRRGGGAAAGAAHAARHRPRHQRRPAEPGRARRKQQRGDLGGGDRAAGRAPLRPGRLRRAAVGAVLVRHHRAAQGHRARSRRRPARALQATWPAPRRRPRQPGVLVHHDQLDHVEHRRVRPARRRADRAVRRQPRLPGRGAPVADRRRPAGRRCSA